MKELKKITAKTHNTDRFADFFREASTQEKEEVFREAAKRANEDQRAILQDSK
ncbi:MAG TPA: hypothetical protein VF974_01485 [Patescibacteria group bacterium]